MLGRSTLGTKCGRWLAVALAALLFAPVAVAGNGIVMKSVTAPVIDPNPVGAYEWADLSFSFTVDNQPPCRPAMTSSPSPVCVMLLGWRVSLDGEWMHEGTTHLAAGHVVHEPYGFPDGHDVTYDVNERVLVAAEPGEYTVHVVAGWLARVPVTTLPNDLQRWYPCGLWDSVPNPVIGCSYGALGWKSAPLATVTVKG